MKAISLDLEPDRYIVAVSGGVDSMVLLDLLARYAQAEAGIALIVAHFDHGIRQDSGNDRLLVGRVAAKWGLSYYWARVALGAKSSEALARDLRYSFLFSLTERFQARAVVTAHHRNDQVETSLMQLMRGSGRRGLGGMQDQPALLRPMLSFSKKEILEYARVQQVAWREDSTNQDLTYKRNRVRQKLLPKLQDRHESFLEKWYEHMSVAQSLNRQIDEEMRQFAGRHIQFHEGGWCFRRNWFVQLPHTVAREVVAYLLRTAGAQDMNKKRIEQLTVLLKTGKIYTHYDVDRKWEFQVLKDKEKGITIKLAQK